MISCRKVASFFGQMLPCDDKRTFWLFWALCFTGIYAISVEGNYYCLRNTYKMQNLLIRFINVGGSLLELSSLSSLVPLPSKEEAE